MLLANAAALAAGLAPGMSTAAASQLCPGLPVLAPNPTALAAAREKIVHLAQQLDPAICFIDQSQWLAPAADAPATARKLSRQSGFTILGQAVQAASCTSRCLPRQLPWQWADVHPLNSRASREVRSSSWRLRGQVAALTDALCIDLQLEGLQAAWWGLALQCRSCGQQTVLGLQLPGASVHAHLVTTALQNLLPSPGLPAADVQVRVLAADLQPFMGQVSLLHEGSFERQLRQLRLQLVQKYGPAVLRPASGL